jgi:hypothetical protein
MNTGLALLIGLGLVHDVPPAPGIDGSMATSAVSVSDSATIVTDGGYPVEYCECDTCKHKDKDCDKCKVNMNTTGDMIPHYPYLPKYHGYYYYRPYNYIMVLEHQYEALSLGGDPRAPYANKLFERIYAEFDAAAYETGTTQKQLPKPTATDKALPNVEDIVKGTE